MRAPERNRRTPRFASGRSGGSSGARRKGALFHRTGGSVRASTTARAVSCPARASRRRRRDVAPERRGATGSRRGSFLGASAMAGDGSTGLYNVSNTCYLNSVLQALSHVREFRECLLSDEAGVSLHAAGRGRSAAGARPTPKEEILSFPGFKKRRKRKKGDGEDDAEETTVVPVCTCPPSRAIARPRPAANANAPARVVRSAVRRAGGRRRRFCDARARAKQRSSTARASRNPRLAKRRRPPSAASTTFPPLRRLTHG